MDQQTQTEEVHRPDYLVDVDLRNRVPEIDDFLDEIDQKVADFARKHRIHPTELRRKVMGKIGYGDLSQRRSLFKIPHENVEEPSDWATLVSLEARNTEGWEFDRAHMQVVGEKFAGLSKDIRLRREIRAHKEVLVEEKKEKKKNNKGKKVLTRQQMFLNDTERLSKYVDYIGDEYNHHIILTGVNGTKDQQYMFPRVRHANSFVARQAAIDIQSRLGCSMDDVVFEHVIGRNVKDRLKLSDEEIEKMKGSQLKKTFMHFATEQWKLASGHDRIPWKELFDEKVLEKQIEGWPANIQVKETDKGKVNIGSIGVEDLRILVEMFNNDEITFTDSSPEKKRKTKK